MSNQTEISVGDRVGYSLQVGGMAIGEVTKVQSDGWLKVRVGHFIVNVPPEKIILVDKGQPPHTAPKEPAP